MNKRPPRRTRRRKREQGRLNRKLQRLAERVRKELARQAWDPRTFPEGTVKILSGHLDYATTHFAVKK